MTDIVERLRATALDKDNFPRMDSERWCSVGLAKEAADEIERLRADNSLFEEMYRGIEEAADEIKRLRTAVYELMGALRELWDEKTYSAEAFDNDPSVKIARRALKGKYE